MRRKLVNLLASKQLPPQALLLCIVINMVGERSCDRRPLFDIQLPYDSEKYMIFNPFYDDLSFGGTLWSKIL